MNLRDYVSAVDNWRATELVHVGAYFVEIEILGLDRKYGAVTPVNLFGSIDKVGLNRARKFGPPGHGHFDHTRRRLLAVQSP